jgi:hypothetical protein
MSDVRPHPTPMSRAAAVDQLKDVYGILSADMDAVMAYGSTNSTPFFHRTVVRTFFSMVEGLAFQMRQVTLATLEPYGRLSVEEVALLREERYSLNTKGEPQTKESFQPVLSSLLFSLRTYVKNHGASFAPDVSHHGWQAMQRSVEIRNRVTHPKSVADLSLSEEDQKKLVDASHWWKRTLMEMFDACDRADAAATQVAKGNQDGV